MISYLKEYYPNRFFIDIRDYHPLIRKIDRYSVFNVAAGVAISSRGFLKWLPEKVDMQLVIILFLKLLCRFIQLILVKVV